jgi:nucleoside-diphosphate-sugar epimerase
VTGAAGFAGSNMVRRLLLENAEIYALLRPGTDTWRLSGVDTQISKLECDLLDQDEIETNIAKISPDVIYNFAFPHGYPSNMLDQINMLEFGLKVTYSLLHAAHQHKIKRFIQVNSSTEYGLSDQPHCETDRLEPYTIRGVSKAASTLLCRQFSRQHHMPVVILRLYSIYGPWEQTDRLIPITCKAILQDHSIQLTQPGIMHDWIFIQDVLEACMAAGNRDLPYGEIINIGTGEQHTNEEVVHTLCEIGARDIRIDQEAYPALKHDTENWVANIEHARELLGWQPVHSLRTGLDLTFRFWKDFLEGTIR